MICLGHEVVIEIKNKLKHVHFMRLGKLWLFSHDTENQHIHFFLGLNNAIVEYHEELHQ